MPLVSTTLEGFQTSASRIIQAAAALLSIDANVDPYTECLFVPREFHLNCTTNCRTLFFLENARRDLDELGSRGVLYIQKNITSTYFIQPSFSSCRSGLGNRF